jgi:hypothetical protein
MQPPQVRVGESIDIIRVSCMLAAHGDEAVIGIADGLHVQAVRFLVPVVEANLIVYLASRSCRHTDS